MASDKPVALVHHAGNDFFIGITPSGHAITLDTDSTRHQAPTPMELLLIAVGSCTAVDVVSILKKQRQELTEYCVEIRGSRREEHPRSYARIEVNHVLHGHNLSPKQVAKAIQLSDEKYCSVAATLRPTARIISSFEIVEAAPDEITASAIRITLPNGHS